ncbi:unnamed protein product, partial [Ascophyllum nodosum]
MWRKFPLFAVVVGSRLPGTQRRLTSRSRLSDRATRRSSRTTLSLPPSVRSARPSAICSNTCGTRRHRKQSRRLPQPWERQPWELHRGGQRPAYSAPLLQYPHLSAPLLQYPHLSAPL